MSTVAPATGASLPSACLSFTTPSTCVVCADATTAHAARMSVARVARKSILKRMFGGLLLTDDCWRFPVFGGRAYDAVAARSVVVCAIILTAKPLVLRAIKRK